MIQGQSFDGPEDWDARVQELVATIGAVVDNK
jgi:hypothetical protein